MNSYLFKKLWIAELPVKGEIAKQLLVRTAIAIRIGMARK
jgi:hypothetical protein